MATLLTSLWPVLTLIATACALFLMGAFSSGKRGGMGALLALAALGITLLGQICQFDAGANDLGMTNSIGGGTLGMYFGVMTSGAGILFVLLAMGGKGSLAVGGERNEYYALLLLSLAGLMLTGVANSLILLFLGLELASIPTYVMVSISRPIPVAQEAGVKYFFLGALSAALMLFGFSYLYGATGSILLVGNGTMQPGLANAAVAAAGGKLMILGVLFVLMGFAFKMAAFPLHVYAADVYEGAATPLTAMLSFVPKAAGLAAVLKVLVAVGGVEARFPHSVGMLVAVIAVITMTAGNVLALLQFNVKRTMAYSSVAHSGYMLAGVAAMLLAEDMGVKVAAMTGALVYIATYAVMNTGVFAVLQQMPSRKRWGEEGAAQATLEERGTASAETFEELAGQARNHPVLGVAMAVCCLALVGLPFTGGFIGKVMIVKPMLDMNTAASKLGGGTTLNWLVVAMMVNAAISAGYYLRLPGAMFFRPAPEEMTKRSPLLSWPAGVVAGLCVAGTLALGIPWGVSNGFSAAAGRAAKSSLNVSGEAVHTADVR